MKQRARYGIDAPGVVRTHIVLGCALAVVAAVGFAWPQPNPIPASLSIGAACVAALVLLYAAVMVGSSLVGKKRVRDRLVAALALSGNERVLDAGCGRGLALIACAKKTDYRQNGRRRSMGRKGPVRQQCGSDPGQRRRGRRRRPRRGANRRYHKAAVFRRVVRRCHLDDRASQHPAP
jgi:hypothetical protein